MQRVLKKVFCFLTIFVIIINVDSIYARNYSVSNSEVVDNERPVTPCWIGWKEWHFGATSPISKKGDPVIFKTPMIQNGVTTYFESVVTTNGYGHYGLDFSKHMLGLLYYIKNIVSDYPTNYIPIYDIPEFDAQGNLIEPTAVTMRKAVEITIGKLLRTWYSTDYEENEFKNFWIKCFTNDHIDELRKLQNDFYWKAYGEEAWSLLKTMMNTYGDNYYKNLLPDQKIALKGVLFSVMEARYRNKNVQGKSDLKIRAAEGELCPFLVNLKNLDKIVRSGSSGHYTYIDNVKQYTFYKFPPFDELIDGVYHWMIYYDSDVLNATTHSTLTSKQTANADEEEINADWESEYWSLTGIPLEALNRKKLEDFYTNCQLARSIFKKSSENSEGIFGAEEVYDITSDINYSEALTNMKTAMQDFANAVGGDVKKIFNGLYSEHIARTYTMAKNIVSTYRIKEEYAYYDIGTNIINYTPGLNGDEYMLIDFQKVKLKSPLEIYNNGRIKTYEDSDNDGVYDRNEIRGKQKVDVTGFIKKMIEKELYGNDDKAIRENQTVVKDTLAQVKYNIFNNRYSFDEENSSNNIQNRKEIYENNMNIDETTRITLNGLTSAAERQQRLAIIPSKIEVELWKYDSNPVLKDTDFDGIDDGLGKEKLREIEHSYGLTDDESDDVISRAIHCKYIPDAVVQTLRKDKNPKDNHFTGKMNTTRFSGNDAIEVEMNMDYRYFFMSNKLYFDELSTMSLLYSNSIYRQGNGQSMHSGIVIANDLNIAENSEAEQMTLRGKSYKNLKVKDMMEFYGFKDVRTYYMGSPGDEGDENKEKFERFREDNTHQIVVPSSEIDTSYNRIGTKFNDIDEIYLGYKDTHKGRVAIGYRTIQYHGLYKTVIGIVIRGTAEDDDWDSDFDMGDLEYKNGINRDKYDSTYEEELKHFTDGYPDWKWDYHHAGFDIVANRILEVVKDYYEEVHTRFDELIELMDENTIDTPITSNSRRSDNFDGVTDAGVCYWVTGHSMGAGVANLVAASLISSEAISDISNLGGNSDNVYCYTFAAPNTFYMTDNRYIRDSHAIPGKNVIGDYREPKGVKYRCIFNIVNDDDFVPKLPMEECEWTKYGRVAGSSFKNMFWSDQAKLNINIVLGPNYRPQITGNYNLYKFATEYRGDSNNPPAISEAFSNIFNNRNKMREETYNYSEKMFVVVDGSDDFDRSLFRYTLPFQKNKYETTYTIYQNSIERNDNEGNTSFSEDGGIIKNVYSQEMTPQYLFASIGEMMHEYSDYENDRDENGRKRVNNKLKFFIMELPPKYYEARKSFLSFIPFNLRALYLEHPHYLESYYALTKTINAIDFN